MVEQDQKLFNWAKDLFPFCRSITGRGIRESLGYIKNIIPELSLESVNSGETFSDWAVPEEWEITEAYVEDLDGKRWIDFKENNLSVLGYSTPIDDILDFEALSNNIFTCDTDKTAIPYVTSYYKKRWGFCTSQDNLDLMKKKGGKFKAVIKSRHFNGKLNWGEVFLKGNSDKEILFSTYLCHPSMANNELSGPVVQMGLINFIKQIPDRHYSYRFLFIPETIGSIIYTNKNLESLKENTLCGFVLTCLGDEGDFSYVPSRYGNNYADRIVNRVFKNNNIEFKKYSFFDRGSDERQYCWPTVDLPICSVTKTKYGAYKEYHTSKDDLSFISGKGLNQSLDFYKKCVTELESNRIYFSSTIGEPQLGKYGLYPTISSTASDYAKPKKMINIIVYCDGTNDLTDLSAILNIDVEEVSELAQVLMEKGLLK